jgi:hypothetical protein
MPAKTALDEKGRHINTGVEVLPEHIEVVVHSIDA